MFSEVVLVLRRAILALLSLPVTDPSQCRCFLTKGDSILLILEHFGDVKLVRVEKGFRQGGAKRRFRGSGYELIAVNLSCF